MLCSETQASANHRIILSRTGYLQGFSLHLQISSPAPQINIYCFGHRPGAALGRNEKSRCDSPSMSKLVF